MIIKVCACQHDGDDRKFYFRAPADAEIKKEDRVLCDTRYGIYPATVKAVNNMSDEELAYKVLLEMTGASHPLKKIRGVYQYEELKYDDNEVKKINPNTPYEW